MRSKPRLVLRALGSPCWAWSNAVTLLAGMVLSAMLALPAYAAATPSQFVQTNANEGVAILSDKSLSEDQRRSKFRTFMLSLVDERRIALFTLGTFRRDASEGDLDAFVDAFVDYSVATYESRLCKYTGQTLKVTEVKEPRPNDFTVTTVVQDGDRPSNEPIRVGFRLSKEGETFTVVDIHVEGIWLALSQRDEFTTLLKKNNGSVPILTDHVRKLAARQQAQSCE